MSIQRFTLAQYTGESRMDPHTIGGWVRYSDYLEAIRTKDALLTQAADLLHCLSDDSKCWFDHHGGCQQHGFLSLEPGQKCPQAEARELLAKLPVISG